jgi:hypothetical protein
MADSKGQMANSHVIARAATLGLITTRFNAQGI